MNGKLGLGIVLGLMALSGSVTAAEPVAAGYPAWTGVTESNRLLGRALLSGAELRQRITVVVTVDGAKVVEQLESVGRLAIYNGIVWQHDASHGGWMDFRMPHDVIVLFVVNEVKDAGEVRKLCEWLDDMKYPGITTINTSVAPVYQNITFPGAPDTGGKLPYVYVMGPDGSEPVFKEPCGLETMAHVEKVIEAERQKLQAAGLVWKPFYGYVTELKHYRELKSLLDKGKSLSMVETKLKKGILSKDPETAKEAQMLYDAFEQTRGDFLFVANQSVAVAPHVAAYASDQMQKYWPSSKKLLAGVSEILKANVAAKPLIRVYPKIALWSEPSFACKNAGDAKKIVGELKQMKASIAPLVASGKNLQVQGSAALLDMRIDELIAAMPDKVAK